jgi:hypothetical protein
MRRPDHEPDQNTAAGSQRDEAISALTFADARSPVYKAGLKKF